MIVTAKMAEGFRILQLDELERSRQGLPVSTREIASFLGVTFSTVTHWRQNLPSYLESLEKRKGEKKKILAIMEQLSPQDEPMDWLRKRTQDANEALLKSVQKGSPASIRTFYQLLGLLSDKVEVKIGLSADEIARRHLGARQELREQGYVVTGEGGEGVGEVSDEPALLPD